MKLGGQHKDHNQWVALKIYANPYDLCICNQISCLLTVGNAWHSDSVLIMS